MPLLTPLTEFPGVSVDQFNTDSSVFLLSHCHTDHLVGLENKTFASLVHCSNTTKKLLSLDAKFAGAAQFLKPMEENVRVPIIIGRECLSVTAIPSVHCPGSVMFLIESKDKAVLCTGDIRAEPWWTQSLAFNELLFPYTTTWKTLDNIYFDSTFAYRGEPFIEMMGYADAVESVVNLLQLYPLDPEVQFLFADSTYGFEQAWLRILNVVGGNLHVSTQSRCKLSVLAAGLEKFMIDSCNLLSQKTFHTHACGCRPRHVIRIKRCIDFNILDYSGVFLPLKLSTISKLEKEKLVLKDITGSGTRFYEFRNRSWLLPKNGEHLLPCEIKLIYSRHASYSEIHNFISLFRPKQVFPIATSKQTWTNGFTMERVFGDVCTGDSFHYDQMMTEQFGPAEPRVLQKGVTVIDRWNPEQCSKEAEFALKAKEQLQNGVTEFNCRGFISPIVKRQRRKARITALTHGGQGTMPFIEEQQRKYAFFSEVHLRKASTHARLGGHSQSDTDSSDTLSVRESPKRPRLVRNPSVAEVKIESSFGSFEKSIANRKLSGSKLYKTEFTLDEVAIHRVAERLEANSLEWLGMNLQCID